MLTDLHLSCFTFVSPPPVRRPSPLLGPMLARSGQSGPAPSELLRAGPIRVGPGSSIHVVLGRGPKGAPSRRQTSAVRDRAQPFSAVVGRAVPDGGREE